MLKEFMFSFDNPQSMYEMDESGFPLNNRRPTAVNKKHKIKPEFYLFKKSEIGEYITIFNLCCNTPATYIFQILIFKRVRKRPEFQNGSLPYSAVEKSDLSYGNEVSFLLRIPHFKKI
jgi:hypothetical protein